MVHTDHRAQRKLTPGVTYKSGTYLILAIWRMKSPIRTDDTVGINLIWCWKAKPSGADHQGQDFPQRHPGIDQPTAWRAQAGRWQCRVIPYKSQSPSASRPYRLHFSEMFEEYFPAPGRELDRPT